jgi:AraC-like DNA-binding protein
MCGKLSDKFQENLSRPGIIDDKARHRAAARLLRNTDTEDSNKHIIEEIVNQVGYIPEVLNEFKA